ncbi:MAG: IS200/IS605 family transposase [Candidatus Cloacimonadales bacterium]
MAQTLSMNYLHIVFSTKNRSLFLKDENIRKQLYLYITKIISEYESIAIEIGGHQDHVHIFLNLSKNICLKDLVSAIKKNTSKWIKTKGEEYSNFYWQSGYGSFSVGEAQKAKTIDYIKRQDEHHRKVSFQEEFITFLEKNNIDYNEQYLWD